MNTLLAAGAGWSAGWSAHGQSPRPQVYRSFEELAKHNVQGLDYNIHVIDRNSPVTVVALHGGGIEWGTDQIATALAQSDYNLYIFKGLRRDGNRHLHIASHQFNEPQLLNLLKKSRTVISIHGYHTATATATASATATATAASATATTTATTTATSPSIKAPAVMGADSYRSRLPEKKYAAPVLLGGRGGLKHRAWQALRPLGLVSPWGPNPSFKLHGRRTNNIVNHAGQKPAQGLQIELPLLWRHKLLNDPTLLQSFTKALDQALSYEKLSPADVFCRPAGPIGAKERRL